MLNSVMDLTERYRSAYLLRKAAEREVDILKKNEAEAEQDLIDKMLVEGVDKLTTEHGTFSFRREIHASYDKDREQEVFEWFRRNEQGGLVKETIHPKTLSAWVAEQREDGLMSWDPTERSLTGMIDFPEFFNIYTRNRIGYRTNR